MNGKMDNFIKSVIAGSAAIVPIIVRDGFRMAGNVQTRSAMSSCTCHSSCGSNFSLEKKCSCYASCGSNFSKHHKCSCYSGCGSNYSME